MFETVSPEAFIRRDRFILYETLPLSIALHILVIGCLVWSALLKTGFPELPPRLSFSYRIAEIDPPPPPPPPPPPQAAQPLVKPVEVPLDQVVAPTVIPDAIPAVEPIKVISAEVTPAPPTGVEGGVAGGVPGGDPNAGVVGGTVAAPPKGVLGGFLLDDGRVHFAKETPLPLFAEHQDYPEYPESARRKGIEDSVTVRYTIDKRGRITSIEVLDHPEHPVFEDATLAAIRKWRFRPLVVEGEKREVVHDLTVFFRLN